MLALRDFPTICGPQFDVDPAGAFLAFCVPKSLKDASRFFLSAIGGGEGELHIIDLNTGDLWLPAASGGLGVLSPLWSPDSAMIAVAVTDGTFIYPAVVDAKKGTIRILIERNLDLPGSRHFFKWLDNNTLACDLTAGNEPTLWLDIEKRGALASMVSWKKAWAGRDSTASPLTSVQSAVEWKVSELCTIDIRTGAYQTFAPEAMLLPEPMRAFVGRPGPDYPPRCVGLGNAVPPESVEVASHPESGQIIYLTRNDDGTRVLRLANGEAKTIFETDSHMREVLPSGSLLIQFTTRQGRNEMLRCILPPDYHDGEKRPAVLWVYPGASVTDNLVHRQHRINEGGAFNLHLLAARGFVVILPGMPIDDEARGGRELAECLVDSALPACETVVRAGYVDPASIHVAGHSLGGWATLMLLTETDLFRSGIALAGTSNLLSSSDDVRMRYGEICEDVQQTMMEENFLLSGPPWQMIDRYVRNSPLFSVEKITAPVLMLHGDQDYVEIGQSEQMFSALRALNRKAELVRYWGEGHVLESPANIRDAWSRITEWVESLGSLSRAGFT